MFKKQLLVLLCIFVSSFLFAQNQRAMDISPRPISYKGYDISALQLDDGTYGFAISQGTTPIMVQRKNPFTLSSKGLKSKEEATKVAEWLISQQKPEAKWKRELSKPLSRRIARELSIETNL